MAKSKYTDEFPELAFMYARQGLIDEEIAAKLGISHDTFYKYQKKYPEFSEALKKGKAPVDFEVEQALLKSAMGFTHTWTEQVIRKNADGSESLEEIERRKYYPPSNTAQIFWLCNRNRKRWRNVNQTEVAVSGDYDKHLAKIADALSRSDTTSD